MSPSRAVLGAAVVANVLGWLAPAVQDFRGWSAFTAALSPLWSPEDFRGEPVWLLILMVASALTNLLFVGLAALILRGRNGRGVLYAASAAALLNLHWVITLESDRRYLASGYFVWIASFALLALSAFLALRPPRR